VEKPSAASAVFAAHDGFRCAQPILRGCESFDFRDFPLESNQGLSGKKIAKIGKIHILYEQTVTVRGMHFTP
jgi:hypothetical protein